MSSTTTTRAEITPDQTSPPQTHRPPLTTRPWQLLHLVRFNGQITSVNTHISMYKFVFLSCLLPLVPAAPGIISASPYGGAHAFPPTFAIQQTGKYNDMWVPYANMCRYVQYLIGLDTNTSCILRFLLPDLLSMRIRN